MAGKGSVRRPWRADAIPQDLECHISYWEEARARCGLTLMHSSSSRTRVLAQGCTLSLFLSGCVEAATQNPQVPETLLSFFFFFFPSGEPEGSSHESVLCEVPLYRGTEKQFRDDTRLVADLECLAKERRETPGHAVVWSKQLG